MISISNPRSAAARRRRHVTERERCADAVSEASRRHPADGFAVMPDRLVADGIGILRRHLEAEQPQRAAGRLFLGGGRAADELALREVHEAPEPRLERTIDRPEVPRPAAEALFDAHAVERPAAEEPQPMFPAGTRSTGHRARAGNRTSPRSRSRDCPVKDTRPTYPGTMPISMRRNDMNGKAAVVKSSRTKPCSSARELGPAIESPVYCIAQGRTVDSAGRQMPLEPAHVVGFGGVRADQEEPDRAKRGTW